MKPWHCVVVGGSPANIYIYIYLYMHFLSIHIPIYNHEYKYDIYIYINIYLLLLRCGSTTIGMIFRQSMSDMSFFCSDLNTHGFHSWQIHWFPPSLTWNTEINPYGSKHLLRRHLKSKSIPLKSSIGKWFLDPQWISIPFLGFQFLQFKVGPRGGLQPHLTMPIYLP